MARRASATLTNSTTRRTQSRGVRKSASRCSRATRCSSGSRPSSRQRVTPDEASDLNRQILEKEREIEARLAEESRKKEEEEKAAVADIQARLQKDNEVQEAKKREAEDKKKEAKRLEIEAINERISSGSRPSSKAGSRPMSKEASREDSAEPCGGGAGGGCCCCCCDANGGG